MEHATPEGTRAFADRHATGGAIAEGSYRRLDGLVVSSVGLGTYLGEADDETDMLYVEAALEAIRHGCNLFDSAANYRFQRSERAIGAALERAVASGLAERSEVVVATKGGYVPFDGAPPAGRDAARRYVAETFIDTGVCNPAEFAGNFQHCMAPGYLEHQVAQSLENLGLESLDIYYVHNPESQLREVSPDVFDQRIRDAFALLERLVDEGRIGRYGVATWNGFRVAPAAPDYLSLARLVDLAREAGGEDHHFRVIQLPYNLAMPEAYAAFNQQVGDEAVTPLEAARRLGVSVVASASLMQARLTGALPAEVTAAFPLASGAEQALQFVRSTPGVTCALAGMARTAHVRQNLSVLREPPAPPEVVSDLFE
jgi:aryl-alcohol dehydrogenase-like predicted oxidoreductase